MTNDLPMPDDFACSPRLKLADVERLYTLRVLRDNDDNRTRTAKALGIGTNTLWRKLKAWGVPPARRGGPR